MPHLLDHLFSVTSYLMSTCGSRDTVHWHHADFAFSVNVSNKLSESIKPDCLLASQNYGSVVSQLNSCSSNTCGPGSPCVSALGMCDTVELSLAKHSAAVYTTGYSLNLYWPLGRMGPPICRWTEEIRTFYWNYHFLTLAGQGKYQNLLIRKSFIYTTGRLIKIPKLPIPPSYTNTHTPLGVVGNKAKAQCLALLRIVYFKWCIPTQEVVDLSAHRSCGLFSLWHFRFQRKQMFHHPTMYKTFLFWY